MVLLTVKITTQNKYFFRNPKCITKYDIREPTRSQVVSSLHLSGSLCVVLEHTDLFEGWNV